MNGVMFALAIVHGDFADTVADVLMTIVCLLLTHRCGRDIIGVNITEERKFFCLCAAVMKPHQWQLQFI
jgi:hypothetical protein